MLSGVDGDNDELDLVRSLVEGLHYVLVPQEVWKKLIEWSVLVCFLSGRIFSKIGSLTQKISVVNDIFCPIITLDL